MKLTILGLVAAAAAFGQTFEVASVKPSAPMPAGGGRFIVGGNRGGVGARDPTRYTCNNCTLTMLLTQAYDIKRYQLTFPGWMDTERYDISAKIPEGTTKEQVAVMVQNLLIERFQMAIHRDKKEMQVYDLVVAKGGPKFAEHVEEAPKEPSPDGDGPPRLPLLDGRGGGRGPDLDKDGYPTLPKDCKGCMVMMNGKARLQAYGETMAEFANQLANQVGRPVYDATGLRGKYDFAVTFDGGMMRGMPLPPEALGGGRGGPPAGAASSTPVNASDPDGGIPILGAIQSQLGLKLESKKGTAEMIVVDHAEKTPTEN